MWRTRVVGCSGGVVWKKVIQINKQIVTSQQVKHMGKKKNSLQLNWRGVFQAVKARREKRFEQQIYCVRLGKGSIRVGFEKLSWHCHKKTANVSTGTEAFLE